MPFGQSPSHCAAIVVISAGVCARHECGEGGDATIASFGAALIVLDVPAGAPSEGASHAAITQSRQAAPTVMVERVNG
jgi:hypothetical protein